jgi:hypothetical protein
MSQQKETEADQSERQEPGGNVVAAALDQKKAASQVCIQFKMLSGNT